MTSSIFNESFVEYEAQLEPDTEDTAQKPILVHPQ